MRVAAALRRRWRLGGGRVDAQRGGRIVAAERWPPLEGRSRAPAAAANATFAPTVIAKRSLQADQLHQNAGAFVFAPRVRKRRNAHAPARARHSMCALLSARAIAARRPHRRQSCKKTTTRALFVKRRFAVANALFVCSHALRQRPPLTRARARKTRSIRRALDFCFCACSTSVSRSPRRRRRRRQRRRSSETH